MIESDHPAEGQQTEIPAAAEPIGTARAGQRRLAFLQRVLREA
jgi:hypothetical protein